jgi:pimeloyl-ACP methyl ester carboxylesterase
VALVENFVDNDGVKIRYLERDPCPSSGRAVVFVPGIVDFADDYIEAFECFGDRRVLVVEMRGRGGSDAPPSGYSVPEQASDVEAVLEAAQVGPFHLMTFSRGTTPSLELAFRRPDRILSVSIGDYLPVEVGLTRDFVDGMWASRWRGTPVSSRVPRHVLEGIQEASRARQFWDDLAGLAVPVLVGRGESGGIVNDENEKRYRQAVPDLEVVTMPGAGHDLFRPSRTAYPRAVMEFIARRCPGS